MESLNRVIAKAPENKEAFLDRALVHVEIGNKQEALSDYTKSGIKPTPIDPIKDPDKMKLAHAIVEELKETVQIPFDMAMGSAEGIAGNLKRLPGNLVDVTKAYARLPLDATHLVFSAITDPKQVSMQMVDETMALVDYIEKTTIDDFLSKALGVEGKAEWLKLPVADKFKRILRAANDVVMDVAVPGTAFKAAKEFQALNKAMKVAGLEVTASQKGLELAHATNVGSKIVRGEEVAEILVPLRTAEQKAASVAGKAAMSEDVASVFATLKTSEQRAAFKEGLAFAEEIAADFNATALERGIIAEGKAATAIEEGLYSGLDKLVFQSESEAYIVAKNGGKHASVITEFGGKPAKEIQKSIRSYEKLIIEHKDKVANPSKYCPDWDTFHPNRQKALVEKIWPTEIQCYTEQMDILQTILNKRQ